jgi:hypothetical protein
MPRTPPGFGNVPLHCNQGDINRVKYVLRRTIYNYGTVEHEQEIQEIEEIDMGSKLMEFLEQIRRDSSSTSQIGIAVANAIHEVSKPIPIRLFCPTCGQLHIDTGKFATKPHHTHACQYCGNVWRPAVVHTVGVEFLPGFKDDSADLPDDIKC